MRKLILPIIIIALLVLHLGLGHGHATNPAVAIKTNTSQATMRQKILGAMSDNPTVDTSVSLIDLNSGSHQHYGISDSFEAASVTKLLTGSEFLHSVEAGSETTSKDLGGEIASVALQQMVVNSDNNAWQLLTNDMGDDQLANYATSIGLNNFNVADNTLTSDDIALLLQKLYKGQLLNKTDTKLLLSYMKQANEADFIPPAVPKDDTVYHKAGLLEDRVHDTAIITSGQRAFVLVVFTNGHGIYDMPSRTQMIQAITKASVAHYLGL